MLTRRIIRVRAMKCLYSYFTNKNTSFDIFINKIKTICPKENLKEYIDLFDKLIDKSETIQQNQDLHEDILEIIISFKTNIKLYKKNLLIGLEEQESMILNNYYLGIYILLRWKYIAESRFDKMKKYETPGSSFLDVSNYFQNKILNDIETSDFLKKLSKKVSPKFAKLDSSIDDWYNEILKKDKTFIEYCSFKKKDGSDSKILAYLIKKVILKSSIIKQYFKDIDPMWNLTNSIVKNLLLKTITDYSNNYKDINFQITQIITQEESNFYKNITEGVVNKWDYILNIFNSKIKNWDLNRLFFIDKILISMAAYEILFYKTPSNVAINEYIEISKIYSTPKSKKFINGVLDNFVKIH